jgi:hypothetical protein
VEAIFHRSTKLSSEGGIDRSHYPRLTINASATSGARRMIATTPSDPAKIAATKPKRKPVR